jgi:peptidoglycan/LPS O-acetylase OafA/YrhL
MERLKCLDGLRGVLAVYVMLSHMAPFALLPVWLASALSHGGAAVDVFFILSGLVIVRSLERFDYRARPFLAARVARIFPVYLAMLALAVAVQPLPDGFERMPWIAADSPARDIWSQGWPRNWAAEIAAHLTMTHGLLPNGLLPDAWVSFLGAAWSLSTEWQFYMLALLLGRRAWFVLLGLAVAGMVWAAATPEPWHFSRAFLANKAGYFALGMLSAALVGVRNPPRPLAGRGRFLFALAAVLAWAWWQGGIAKLVPPLVWAACLAAELRPGWWSAVLRARPAQWFGGLSYSLYLANEPIQKLFGVGLSALTDGDGRWFTVFWVPGAVGLPLLAAMALRRWIELPALAWGRRGVYTRGHENSR